jgi:hypothetical protein
VIGDVDIAIRIDDDVARMIQRGAPSLSAVASESGAAIACQSADGAVRRHLPDLICQLFDDVEVPGAVERQAGDTEETNVRRGMSVIGAAAGHGDDRLPVRRECSEG